MKIMDLLKKKKKIIIAFVLGLIIPGIVVYADSIASNNVSYTNNSQSNVQGAIDDLYSKASAATLLSTEVTTPGGTVFAVLTGENGYACNSNINGKLLCVRNGPASNTTDYNARKAELEQACALVGGSFNSNSSIANCRDSSNDFRCYVNSRGSASCSDNSSRHGCLVNGFGSVDCG